MRQKGRNPDKFRSLSWPEASPRGIVLARSVAGAG